MNSFSLGQITDSQIVNGSSFFCADEFAFINLHALATLELGGLCFMSASSFLLKSIAVFFFMLTRSDLTNLANLKIGHFAFLNVQKATFCRLLFLFFLTSRPPRFEQLHSRRSLHRLQRAHIAEFFSAACLILDVPYLQTISFHNALSFSSLITAVLFNCSSQFHSICCGFNPLGVAVIDHNVDFLIDPFNEIHMEHIQTYIPKSDAGDYWFGEVDEYDQPNGEGLLVTQNQVVRTNLCNGQFNGWTEIYQTEDFQEVFTEENEKGVFVNGKRCGTFVKQELNGTFSYRSYLDDRPFPEDFVTQYNGSNWVISNEIIRSCRPLLRKEICPLFFDCASKITLARDVSFPREFVLLQGLVETLVFDGCESSSVVNVVIEHCARLKKIEVKNRAFSNAGAQGCFWVAHCPQLSSISVRDDGCCANMASLYLLGG